MQTNITNNPPPPQRVSAIRPNKFQAPSQGLHIHNQNSLSPRQIPQQTVQQRVLSPQQHQHLSSPHQNQHLQQNLSPQHQHIHVNQAQPQIINSAIPQANINLFNQNNTRNRALSQGQGVILQQAPLDASIKSISQISVASNHHHHHLQNPNFLNTRPLSPVNGQVNNVLIQPNPVHTHIQQPVQYQHVEQKSFCQDKSIDLSHQEQKSVINQTISQTQLESVKYSTQVINQQMYIPVQPVQAVQKMVPVKPVKVEKEVVVEKEKEIIEKPVYYEKIIEKEVYINEGNDEDIQKYIAKIEFLERDLESYKLKLKEHRDIELNLNNELDIYKQKYQDLLDQPTKVEYIEKIVEKPVEVDRYIEVEKATEQIIHYDHKEELFQLQSDKEQFQIKYDDLAEKYILACAELQSARFSNRQKEIEQQNQIAELQQQIQNQKRSTVTQRYTDQDYLQLQAKCTYLESQIKQNEQIEHNDIHFVHNENEEQLENERSKRTKKVQHQHQNNDDNSKVNYVYKTSTSYVNGQNNDQYQTIKTSQHSHYGNSTEQIYSKQYSTEPKVISQEEYQQILQQQKQNQYQEPIQYSQQTYSNGQQYEQNYQNQQYQEQEQEPKEHINRHRNHRLHGHQHQH